MARMYTKGMEIVPGFRLVQLLGRGGFGEVWKAAAPGGTDAAIKIISLRERYGFKEYRSLQLVKQLRHPNLVPILAFWLMNEDGQLFDQVMGDATLARRAQDKDQLNAMVLGEKNLLDRLQECQKQGQTGIPSDELMGYMQDAAKAIDFLNQPIHPLDEGGIGGIQHCDIKPQNILIVGGAAQVCDFGLARMMGDARVTSAKGSAAYMAPELILDNKPSQHTDQYCLAISYVELRTGALPLNIASPAAAIYAHAQGKLDLSKLSPAEQTVIRRAASVEPNKRFGTTVEMVRALRQAVERPAGLLKSGFRPTLTLDELIKPGVEVVPGYKLLKLLGQGGYGQVWEAIAPGGKHTALKIIRNLEGTHGKQEFKALELIKGVEHNHLMELHAFWLLDKSGRVIADMARARPDAPPPNTLVIATKLASQNLQQRLKECQDQGQEGIPSDELLGYMRQAAAAIDYLNAPQHQLVDRLVSIQHRDIKPENILLASGVVKVGDFGLAKVVEGTSAVIHGDSAGLTLVYAPPEVFQNRVTAFSDQYSLAITYFKLRTGELPFPATSRPNDIIQCHLNGRLELDRLPAEERTVIARATAVKPEERYPICAALVEALDRARRADSSDLQSMPTLDFVPPFAAARTPQRAAAAPGVYTVPPAVAVPDAATDVPPLSDTAPPPKPVLIPTAGPRAEAVRPATRPDAGVRRPAPSDVPPDADDDADGDVSPRPGRGTPPPQTAGRRPAGAKKTVAASWKATQQDPQWNQAKGAGAILAVAVGLLVIMLALAAFALKGQFGLKKVPAEKPKAGNKETAAATKPDDKTAQQADAPKPVVDRRRTELFGSAEEALDLLDLQLRKVPNGKDQGTEQLRQTAKTAVEGFGNEYPGTPEAHALKGRLYELQNDQDRASDEYLAGLPSPMQATAEQLPQLLARIGFFLNPKWSQPINAVLLVGYADRARQLAEQPGVDPSVRVRALCLGARANLRAADRASDDQRKSYAEKSDRLLKDAERAAEQADAGWRSAYEMALQLYELNRETRIEQYDRRARHFLDLAGRRGPQEKRVDRLRALAE